MHCGARRAALGSEGTLSVPPTRASGTVVAVAPAADRADSAAAEGGGDGPHTTSAMPSRCGIGSGRDGRGLSPARAWRANRVAAAAPGRTSTISSKLRKVRQESSVLGPRDTQWLARSLLCYSPDAPVRTKAFRRVSHSKALLSTLHCHHETQPAILRRGAAKPGH